MEMEGTHTHPHDLDDEKRLEALGYKQTLSRILGAFENFSVTFGTVGFVSGVSALYGYGMTNGGPQAMFVNWVVISFLAVLTSMVMAEICSSMPTAGGLCRLLVRCPLALSPNQT